MDNKKLISIIIVVLVLVAGGAGFWYWQKRAKVSEKPAAVEIKDGLGAEAFNKTKNPLANELPGTNPFEVNTNPFKEQKNPFDALYKNPFK